MFKIRDAEVEAFMLDLDGVVAHQQSHSHPIRVGRQSRLPSPAVSIEALQTLKGAEAAERQARLLSVRSGGAGASCRAAQGSEEHSPTRRRRRETVRYMLERNGCLNASYILFSLVGYHYNVLEQFPKAAVSIHVHTMLVPLHGSYTRTSSYLRFNTT